MSTEAAPPLPPTDEQIFDHVLLTVVNRPKLRDALIASGVTTMANLLTLKPSEYEDIRYPEKGKLVLVVGDISAIKMLRALDHYHILNDDMIELNEWINLTRKQYDQFRVYDRRDYDRMVSSVSLPSPTPISTSSTKATRRASSFVAFSSTKEDEDIDSSTDNSARSPPMPTVRSTSLVIGNDIVANEDFITINEPCFSTSSVSTAFDDCVHKFSTSLNMVRNTVEDIVDSANMDLIYGHHAIPVIDEIDSSCYTPTTCDLVDPFVGELKEPVNDDSTKTSLATRQPPCCLLTGRLGQAVMSKEFFRVDKLLANELPTYDRFPACRHHPIHPAMNPYDDDEKYGTVFVHDTDDEEYEIVFVHDPGGGCSNVFQEAFSEEFTRELLSPPWPYDRTISDRLSDNDIAITLGYSNDKLTVHQRTPDQQPPTHHVNLYRMLAYDHLKAHPHELVDNVYNVVDIVDTGTGDVVNDTTIVHDNPPPSDNDLVLVDRGANSEVVITDIRVTVTYRADYKVDIHKHMINGVYFGLGGSVVTTEKGPVVILVLHQYALLLGKGRMVHAHRQPLLWYNNDINVKSSKVNGRIKTHSGFVTPLVFHRLLIRCIRPFSDDDWKKSLHVNLIDKLELDPIVLDYDPYEHEGWFDTTNDIELSHSVTHFDVFCQYRRRVTDQRTECLHRNVVAVPPTSYTSTVHEPERSAQRPLFGWVQPDVITMTLARPGTTLKRTFILNTPSLLVYRHPEYVVCDEVCFDMSANDDGPNDTVLCMGLRPMVSDVYDTPLDLQYDNTHVNIMCYRILTSALEILRCDGDDFGRRTDLANGEVHHSSPPPLVVRSRRGTSDQQVDDDLPSSPTLSDYVVTLVDLVDRTFLLDKQEDRTIPRTQTVGMIEGSRGSPMEKTIVRNDLLNCLLRDEQASSVPRQIVLYQHVDRIHPDNGSSVNIMATWKNGEITPKPPTIVAADDPVTCAIFAYGFTIPRSYQHTISLVRTNSNTKWFDAIAVPLVQVDVYATLDDIGNASAFGPPKVGYRQSRTVADGHPIDAPSEAVHSGSVSLRGYHLVQFATELNDSTTLSTADFTIHKRDSQATTMIVVHTTPPVQEQSSSRLDCSSCERGVCTTGVDTVLGFGRFTVNPEPSNVRMVPIDGELPHPRKHVKFRMSPEFIEINVDPLSEIQPTSFDARNNIKLVIDVIGTPIVRTFTSNFALVWPILLFLRHPAKKFVFSKAVALATVRPASASNDMLIIVAMSTVLDVTAYKMSQDIVDLPGDTPDNEATHTATSSSMSTDIICVPQDTCSTSSLAHAQRLCSLKTMFCCLSLSAMDWTKFKEPTRWIPRTTQGNKVIPASLDLLVGAAIELMFWWHSLSVHLSSCSYGRPHDKFYKRHIMLSLHRVGEVVASGMVVFTYLPGRSDPADILSKHWSYSDVWHLLKPLLFWQGDTVEIPDP